MTMGLLLAYSIYGGVFLAFGYTAYRWLLARHKYGIINRRCLLGIYMTALLAMPLIMSASHLLTATDSVQGAIIADTPALQGVVTQPAGELRIMSWLIWIYAAGCSAVVLHFIYGLVRLHLIIASGAKEKYGDCTLVRIAGCRTPFSYGRYIVIGTHEHAQTMIIAHEMAHITQQHRIDLWIAQAVCTLMWYNPTAWLMRNQLRDVHEYLADEEVIRQGHDVIKYQELLIEKAIGTRLQPLTNSLNQSNIYKRITMMYKKTPSGATRLRVLGLMPALIMAATVCVASPVASTVNLAAATSMAEASLNSSKVTQISESAQPGADSDVEKAPYKLASFNGGESELINFLIENIHYPEEALKAGEEGKVIVKFVVETDGSISNVEITKSVTPALDKEAIRVVNSMPRWTPAFNKEGQPVRCFYILPVSFKAKR
ncbi:MAG: M56 family metallopeptidase [Paramuribaculum sp.]|nr:M56 family metallopeptidase [Paramuribaculum sp.]